MWDTQIAMADQVMTRAPDSVLQRSAGPPGSFLKSFCVRCGRTEDERAAFFFHEQASFLILTVQGFYLSGAPGIGHLPILFSVERDTIPQDASRDAIRRKSISLQEEHSKKERSLG